MLLIAYKIKSWFDSKDVPFMMTQGLCGYAETFSKRSGSKNSKFVLSIQCWCLIWTNEVGAFPMHTAYVKWIRICLQFKFASQTTEQSYSWRPSKMCPCLATRRPKKNITLYIIHEMRLFDIPIFVIISLDSLWKYYEEDCLIVEIRFNITWFLILPLIFTIHITQRVEILQVNISATFEVSFIARRARLRMDLCIDDIAMHALARHR